MINCSRCHLKDFIDERVLTAHLVNDHLQNATQAKAEAHQAATGIRLDEDGGCDGCHRKDGSHTPSCYLAKNARAEGLNPGPTVVLPKPAPAQRVLRAVHRGVAPDATKTSAPAVPPPTPPAPEEIPMAQKVCGKCKAIGHNARSCGREPKGNSHGPKAAGESKPKPKPATGTAKRRAKTPRAAAKPAASKKRTPVDPEILLAIEKVTVTELREKLRKHEARVEVLMELVGA